MPQNSTSAPLFVFDKDGVLVDSEPIKLALLEDLLAEDFPNELPAICEYNRANIGMARKDKLRHLFAEVIGVNDVEEKVDFYLDKSYHFVKAKLIKAPPIPGVMEFIAMSPNRKFVCSAALAPEVDDQVEALGIAQAFEKLYAFPDRKADVLKALKEEHQKPIVFWGDTRFDYESSIEADVIFIGVQKPGGHEPLAGFDIPTIADFSNPDEIHAIISQALESRQEG